MKKLAYILCLSMTLAGSAMATLIQFGGLTNELSDADYVAQIGATTQIIQWNGVHFNSDTGTKGSFGSAGTFANQGVGASLTSSDYNLSFTTTQISSSNPVRTNTVSSGGKLGVNEAGSASANLYEPDATVLALELNQDVTLNHIVFSGMNASVNDNIQITIGTNVYNLTPNDTDETSNWSGEGNTEVYSFMTPVSIDAGTDIVFEPTGAGTPTSNIWGIHSMVFDYTVIPEPSTMALFSIFGIAMFMRRKTLKRSV